MIMESAILPIEAYYGYALKTNEKPPEVFLVFLGGLGA